MAGDIQGHTIVASIICLIFYIVGLVIFIACFEKVEISEIGLIFNTYIQNVEKTPYDSGRYFLGMGKKFIRYPRQLMDFDFAKGGDSGALSCWSNNGLNVYVDLSFYYRIEPNDVFRFYQTFGNLEWKQIILRQAHAAIKTETTNFNNEDFFVNRFKIKKALFLAIKNKFYELTVGGVKLIDIQLRKISFDDSLEASLVNKLIQLQQLRTYEIRRRSMQILKEIEQIKEQAANNITLIYAEKTAAATKTIYKAKADGFTRVIKQLAASYTGLNNKLNLAWSDELVHFIFANEMPNLYDSVDALTYGVEMAIVDTE